MKHCEDCIHDEVCNMWAVDTGYPFVNADTCVHYKAKSDVIELPCKAGDVVYAERWNFGNVERHQITNLMIAQNKKGNWTKKYRAMMFVNGKTIDAPLDFSFDEIGKKVFLTREEAEQAVKDMRRGDKDGE